MRKRDMGASRTEALAHARAAIRVLRRETEPNGLDETR